MLRRAHARAPRRACTHTHAGDHIKLRALGLAKPCSHSRILPALLTSVSTPESSLKKKKPPLYVRAGLFTLKTKKKGGARHDSEVQRVCVRHGPSDGVTWRVLFCFDRLRDVYTPCRRDDTLAANKNTRCRRVCPCVAHTRPSLHIQDVFVQSGPKYEPFKLQRFSKAGWGRRERLWSPTCGDRGQRYR